MLPYIIHEIYIFNKYKHLKQYKKLRKGHQSFEWKSDSTANLIKHKFPKHSLYISNWLMTSSKIKILYKVLNILILKVLTKSDLKGPLKYQEETLIHLIHMQEGSNPILFGLWGEERKKEESKLT
jgi:hypothetical protein